MPTNQSQEQVEAKGRFRKKASTVSAMRVSEIVELAVEKGPGGMPEWLVQAMAVDPETDEGFGPDAPRLQTLPPSRAAVIVRTKQGQEVVAEADEWIVCAAPDDLWPVDPEVFEATYETPSPNPSQGEVPEKAVEDLRTSLWSSWGRGRETTDWPSRAELQAAVAAALPAIRSQIDQKWEERLGKVQRELDERVEGNIDLIVEADRERFRAKEAEERLKEVERQREVAERQTVLERDRHEDTEERAEKAEAALSRRDQQVWDTVKAFESLAAIIEERGDGERGAGRAVAYRAMCYRLRRLLTQQPSSTSPQQEVEESWPPEKEPPEVCPGCGVSRRESEATFEEVPCPGCAGSPAAAQQFISRLASYGYAVTPMPDRLLGRSAKDAVRAALTLRANHLSESVSAFRSTLEAIAENSEEPNAADEALRVLTAHPAPSEPEEG